MHHVPVEDILVTLGDFNVQMGKKGSMEGGVCFCVCRGILKRGVCLGSYGSCSKSNPLRTAEVY